MFYKQKKNIVLATMLIILAVFCSCKNNAKIQLEKGVDKDYGPGNKDIVVFSTNDTFSAYEENLGFAGLKGFIDKFDRNENFVTIVDAGNFSTGNEVAEKSKGKSSIEIMENFGYEILVPGTHEFDYGLEAFFDNMDNINADVICCNMQDTVTKELLFNPYVIYKYDNIKVAYIGVISPDTLYNEKLTDMFFDENGNQMIYFFEDEDGTAFYKQVQACVDSAIKEGANRIVIVGGLGVNGVVGRWSSTELIANTKNIDAVIDGHSMEVIEKGLNTNKTGILVPIVQAGSHLEYLGAMNITKDGYSFPAVISKKSIKTKDEKFTKIIHDIIKKYNK